MTRNSAANGITALAAAVITATVATAPADATTPPAPTPPVLPAQLTTAITQASLNVRVKSGWEAVTGPATSVNSIRALATILGVSSLSEYTDDAEAGTTVLIFPGDDDTSTGFNIHGPTAKSAANDTSQIWAVTSSDGLPGNILAPGDAEDISPLTVSTLNPVGTPVTTHINFSL